MHYNHALANLALLRESSGGATAVQQQQVLDALAAVTAAGEISELSNEMLARLGYIEGSIHALAGDHEAARLAFGKSLGADANFKLALKALPELDAEPDTATRLLLATADVEELRPELTLSR